MVDKAGLLDGTICSLELACMLQYYLMNVFEEIYRDNAWGFGSGHGSLPAATKGYRNFLQEFLKQNDIKSVVDFGSGDWQFSKLMNWDGIDYVGLETVPSLTEQNTKLYGSSNIKFAASPADYSKMPKADLLIVKDVLQHLSRKEIDKFIAKALPRYKYALITCNFIPEDRLNHDIETGGFRALDIRKAPYSVKATAIYGFGRKRRTVSVKERKFFDPWWEVVLLVTN